MTRYGRWMVFQVILIVVLAILSVVLLFASTICAQSATDAHLVYAAQIEGLKEVLLWTRGMMAGVTSALLAAVVFLFRTNQRLQHVIIEEVKLGGKDREKMISVLDENADALSHLKDTLQILEKKVEQFPKIYQKLVKGNRK